MTTTTSPHDHWSRQLLTRIDVALELGQGTPEESVALAWRSAVRDQPELHWALAASTDPVVVAARRRLHRSVAVAAGLATFDDPGGVAAAAGERFLASVDAASVPAERRTSRLAELLHRIWYGAEPDPWPWGGLTPTLTRLNCSGGSARKCGLRWRTWV